MNLPRFPSIDELELAEELRRELLVSGGKYGVLKWIGAVTDVPVLPHEVLTGPSKSAIDRLRTKHRGATLIRSNNLAELLSCTEGVFDSHVFDISGKINDDWKLRRLGNVPSCPAEHLKGVWPKKKSELKFAAARFLEDSYRCNLVEHPNRIDEFWMTFTCPSGTNFSFLSGRPDYPISPSEDLGEMKDRTGDSLERVIEYAKRVSSLAGFDMRYSKQMEFAFNREELYLTQAKIFLPKRHAPKIVLPENIQKRMLPEPFGIFDVEGEVGKEIIFQEGLKSARLAGEIYLRPAMKVAIFRDADGLFNHKDIPYFLQLEGVIINPYLAALNQLSQLVRLDHKDGDKLRLVSDGYNIRSMPLSK